MSYSQTRLTLYTILSSIEMDLREMIVKYCDADMRIEDVLGMDIFQRALDRFRREDDSSEGTCSLKEIVDFLDFGDAYQVLNKNKEITPSSFGTAIQKDTHLLDILIPIRNRVAHSRPLNFEDFDTVIEITDKLLENSSIEWTHLRDTRSRVLANPGVVLNQTIPNYHQDSVNNNLPIPDFDETGFLGRKDQVDQLMKLLVGPYPVITLIGEGGLGKTALALKVAYEVMDSQKCPFDAIVWSTAKTTFITAQEIIRIQNSISDSLGLFQVVEENLSGQKSTNSVDEILSYLKEFKILLILDNLETVIDANMIRFLEQLPNGSKVLITSRIGLGEFERRVKLDPLDAKESVELLRTLVRLRGVASLKSSNNSHLRTLCQKMQNNPGYIKWFVAAIQSGNRPEQILDQPGLFLDFCLSNVYEYLSTDSKQIVQAMQTIGGQMSQAEISVLTEMELIDLQQALHQLLSTNMVVMKSIGHKTHSETRYGLSELARDYLLKHHVVKPNDFKVFQARKKQMISAKDNLENEKSKNLFSVYSIIAKSGGDLIVAKYLWDALQCVKHRNFEEAQRLVSLARGLAPQYYEVHKVQAWVHANSGNIPAAEESYDVAVELEPNSAPVRMLYGGFLMRYSHDNDRAIEQFKAAEKLAPEEFHIKCEMARLHTYMCQFEEASVILEKIVAKKSIPPWGKRKYFDIKLQMHLRHARRLLHEHDTHSAILHLEKLVECYADLPSSLKDNHIANTLHRAFRLIQRCLKAGGDADTREKATLIQSDLLEFLRDLGQPITDDNSHLHHGEISKINHDKDCAFIESDHGIEYYVNIRQIRELESIDQLNIGDRISFNLGKNYQGTCAINCEIEY